MRSRGSPCSALKPAIRRKSILLSEVPRHTFEDVYVFPGVGQPAGTGRAASHALVATDVRHPTHYEARRATRFELSKREFRPVQRTIHAAKEVASHAYDRSVRGTRFVVVNARINFLNNSWPLAKSCRKLVRGLN